MKQLTSLFFALIVLLGTVRGIAQSEMDLDLTTRFMGSPPTHATIDSVAKWVENPLDQKLTIAVTNLYAEATNYLEIKIGGQRVIFYGAGMDGLGHYIPTNYPPVIVNATLRREYPLNIMCPNSGPQGSPLYKYEDFNNDPDGYVYNLTNGTYSPPVSSFIWTNFSGAARVILTNTDPALVTLRLTNLVQEMNRIITTMSFYTNAVFASFTNYDPIPGIMATNPTAQQIAYVNRLLLEYAIYFPPPTGSPDNSGTAEITFGVKPPPELKIKKNQPAPSYTILINRDSSSDGVLNLANLGAGYASTNSSIIEILKDRFGHFGLGDGCDDATKAPGQGTWLSMGPGCTQDTNRIALEWHVSLGRTFDGLAAGQLAFNQPGLTRDAYTPFSLYYNGAMTNLYATETLLNTNLPYLTTNSDTTITTNQFIPVMSQNTWTNNGQVFTNCLIPVVLIQNLVPYILTNSAGMAYTNYDALLRQIKAYQTFVDIVTPDTNQTLLNFYLANQVGSGRDTNGLYTNFLASPFVVWTIKNPSPATTSNLWITENRLGGGGSTNILVKSISGGVVTWILTQGTGPEQRQETRQVSFTGGALPTDRVELDTIQYATGAIAYQCQETYHFYPWGSELRETRIPNNPDLVTAYDYYTNTAEQYGYYGYGQIKDIIYPDGYWEKRIYEDLGEGFSYYQCPGIGYDVDYDHNWAGWMNGVLKYVLHPYLDGRRGGATSPDSASLANTTYTKFRYTFGYSDLGTGGQSRTAYLCDGFGSPVSILRAQQNGSDDVSNNEGASQETYQTLNPAWNTETAQLFDCNWSYKESAPSGLAGHSWYQCQKSRQLQQFCYYDHGVFDSAANQFVLNLTNHFYTVIGITNFPDHRETCLSDIQHVGSLDLIQMENEYLGLFVDGGTGATNQHLGYFDGRDFSSDRMSGNPLDMYLAPQKGRKKTKIFRGGNLVLVENYAHIGSIIDQWTTLSKLRYSVDSLGRVTNVMRIDAKSLQSRTAYSADYQGGSGYDGNLLLSETDEAGYKTVYTYDSLQRIKTVTNKGFGSQPDRVTSYVYNANGQGISQTTTAGSLVLNESWGVDLAGRLTNHVDTSGIATQITYSSDGRITTQTTPGGITSIMEEYPDRQKKSLQGSGVISRFYDYGTGFPAADFGDNIQSWQSFSCFGNIRLTTNYLGHFGSPRWRGTGKGIFDMDILEYWPLGTATENIAWKKHRNVLYQWFYGLGDLTTSSIDPRTDRILDGSLNVLSQTISYGSETRVNSSTVCFVSQNDNWFEVTSNYICLTDGNDTPTIAGIHMEQLNGFAGTEIARTIDYDADNNQTVTTTCLDRANNKITKVTSQPTTSSLSATNIYQNGLPLSSSTLSVASPTLYFYDALGRTNRIQSPLGYSATMSYDPATGWVTSMTDFTGQTTSYQYYNTNEANAGRLKCQTSATGKKTYYAYTTRGELYRTWGDVPYPAEYRYSEYGDLTNLITYRGGASWTGSSWPGSPGTGDNTYWFYDEASGALLRKTDAQANSVSYTYDTTTGRLLARTWARMNGTNTVSVTNSYNGFGNLTAQEYTDGTPNVYFNNYNRAGQPREIIDGAGNVELAYDQANRLVTSSYTNGLLAGITISNHFNPYYGRDSLSVLGLSSTLKDDYVYDAYGRLSSVGSGIYSAAYGYALNSDLLQTTTCYSNASTILTTTRTWDYGMRLRSIANIVGGTPITSHSYQYDALNRRTKATLEDGSFWQYGYDDRDELTSANRNWATAPASVAGQQFSYAYDNIGNRQTAQFGGDTNGANLRTITYTNNSLNQYIGINTPGFENIIGAALATNSVTVNGGLADRKGEYFHREISVANTNQPVWQNVTNMAGTFTNKGGSLFPANGQALTYDADGNLTADGIWTYQWDAENRLLSMAMNNVANLATTNRLRLGFAYDFMGRRVQKIVSVWNVATNDFVPATTNRFVYDGWNLLAVINSQSSILQSFMWGKDLSGTINRAGGIGGLLMANISGSNCFTAYDGNGNITALINAADKSLVARYEYSPYGELLRETGPLAHQTPFRFSSKFWDDESGLVYYGYRYYAPLIGKWLGRDSIGERGGINLTCFILNGVIGNVDPSGGTVVTVSTEPVANVDWVTDTKLGNMFPETFGRIDADFEARGYSAKYARGIEWGSQEEIAAQRNELARANAMEGAEKAMFVFAVVETLEHAWDWANSNKPEEFIKDANDYYRHTMAGETAWADLDAISMAVNMMELTGRYESAYVVLDILL